MATKRMVERRIGGLDVTVEIIKMKSINLQERIRTGTDRGLPFLSAKFFHDDHWMIISTDLLLIQP